MSYYKKQQQDLALEAESIDNIKKYLEGRFQVELLRTPHYHKFDFYDLEQSIFFEVKSRRNDYTKYPTTMIPQKKIEFARTKIVPNGGKAYFVFHFTDCLCMIEYSEEVFSSFEIKTGGRFDRGGPELNNYCYIPVSALTRLSDYTAPSPPEASCDQSE